MATAALRPSYEDEVKLDSGDRAVIRFIGEVQGKTGVFFGIELRNGAGKNDGTVQNVPYFQCKFKRKNPAGQPVKTGTFVRLERIAVVTNKSRNFPDLCIGDHVQVNSPKFRGGGVVRYVGQPGARPNAQGVRVGIEMDTAVRGGTDGSMNRQPGYFSCRAGRGIYVRPDEITLEPRPPARASRRGRATPPAAGSQAKKKNQHGRSASTGRNDVVPSPRPGRQKPRSASVSARVAAMQSLFNDGIEETKEVEPAAPKKKKKKKKKKIPKPTPKSPKSPHRRTQSDMPAWKIQRMQREKRLAELANQAPVNSPDADNDGDEDGDDEDTKEPMSLADRRAAYAHSATVGVEEAAARRIKKRPSIQNLSLDGTQKELAKSLLEKRVEHQATIPNPMGSLYESDEDDDDDDDNDSEEVKSRSPSPSPGGAPKKKKKKKKGHRRQASRFKVEEIDINDAKLVMTQFGFFQPRAKTPARGKKSRRTRSQTPGVDGEEDYFALPDALVVLNMNNTDMLLKMGESERLAMVRLVAHSIIQSPDLEVVQMCNASIDDAFLIELLDTLSSEEAPENLTEVWLESNPIGNDGFLRLADFMEANQRIEVWKFQRNRKDISTEVIDRLLEAMNANERVVKFEFEFRHIDMRDRCERVLRRNQEAKRLRKLAEKRAAEQAAQATEEG